MDSRYAVAAAAAAAAAANATTIASTAGANDAAAAAAATAISIDFERWERATWIVVFTAMVVVATSGNAIVVYIVATNKAMKSVTNYFLVNLSLADAMVSTLNVVFNFISMLNSHWPFGEAYCKVSNFIAILSISASVFSLTAIACDRYVAILHPLRPRMLHSRALLWVVLIWLASAILAAPNAIASTTVSDLRHSAGGSGEEESLDEQITCTNIWPDGKYPNSRFEHIYNIILFVTTYFVPITTMAVLYTQVGRELHRCVPIGEHVEKQLSNLRAKKKIVKMMIVVVVIFSLCWLPYHAFFIITYYQPLFPDSPTKYQRSYLIMYLLAMSNSMYNPIIIYFMNSRFRREIKRCLRAIFCCCCVPHLQRRAQQSGGQSSRAAYSSRMPLSVAGGGGASPAGSGTPLRSVNYAPLAASVAQSRHASSSSRFGGAGGNGANSPTPSTAPTVAALLSQHSQSLK